MDILESYRARPVPKEMAFSDAEYRERLARVRRAMDAQGLDLLLLHHLPSVCYLTGYQTPVSDWWSEDSVWIVAGSDEVLQPGMTFHGVRSLRIPGLIAAGFSETIAVAETGCEILTPHRRELIVV